MSNGFKSIVNHRLFSSIYSKHDRNVRRLLHSLPKFTSNTDERRKEMLEKMEKMRLQSNKILDMKFGKRRKLEDPTKLQEEESKLQTLKSRFAAEYEQGNFVLRTPHGTMDYGPREMAIREKVLNIVTEVFKRHGAKTIDTPVIELKETLTGKYGEEGGKLIYELEEQGGEKLALRYDLTVPFARYLAINKVKSFKRYQIAKVYRRDNPAITRGRYREFYQCDFDIAGTYAPLLPEAECLRITYEILSELDLGEFEIKVNHRMLLDGMLAVCGVPDERFKSVCTSIDKLDKTPWDDVRKELINERQLSSEMADRIGDYVLLKDRNPNMSSAELLALLKSDSMLYRRKDAKEALDQLEILFEFGDLYGLEKAMVFDPSLARGLDYYTGTIYEAIIKGYANTDVCSSDETGSDELVASGVGSVAGGGRYDKLVGVFDTSGKDVPCVGVSLGIERIFAIVEQKLKEKEKENKEKFRISETDVFVASAQRNFMRERMKLCRVLWDSKIKAETSYKANPKLLDQLQYCEEEGIPLALILGEDEIKQGVVKIRRIATRDEWAVKREELVSELRNRLEAISNGQC